MRRDREPRTWRDAIAWLVSRGARPLRTKGSHQTWRLPNGKSFVVVCNHLGADMGVRLRAQLRRLLCLPSSDDEPPRGSPWLTDGREVAVASA
jgi:predicted RNA binding protein YcfA (HicA-like mRNA interferase family)